jgi:DNA invertase Pin-like site-specific DNA recombinase
MKSVAIYYRVSTDKQDLASQEHAIQTWLDNLPEAKKPKKVQVFKDEGISGKNTKRPGFQAMTAAATKQKIDTIIVYRLDRFSRDASTAIKTILELDQAGVAFISITQQALNLGHDNPFRRTFLAMFADLAELERDTIIARVKAGLEAAKKRGVKLGRKIKITPTIQATVRDLKAKGMSLRQIAAQTNISLSSVHSIVKN